MARVTLPCSVQNITAALLAPEELTFEQETDFPKPGGRLLENPFSTVGLKKKKKGKKGKKGKKKRR
jgi:hypothetical protein